MPNQRKPIETNNLLQKVEGLAAGLFTRAAGKSKKDQEKVPSSAVLLRRKLSLAISP